MEEVKKLGDQLNVVQLNWDQLTVFVNIYWQLCSKSEKVGEYLTHLNTEASEEAFYVLGPHHLETVIV